MAAGQIYATPSAGGNFYGNQLSDVLRMNVQPLAKFRQFTDARMAVGKHRGQTFTWDISGDVAVPGASLSETQTVPQTSIVVGQGTLTVTEFAQAIPYTEFLEDLSKFDIETPTGVALKNECAKTLDRAVWTQFNSTPIRLLASSGTDTGSITTFTNGTCTGTNSIAFTLNHAGTISDIMKARNIPAYRGNDYYAIANPAAYRNMKTGSVGTSNLQSIHQYSDSGLALIMEGEMGRYENIRFIEQTNIAPGIGVTGISSTNSPYTGYVGDMVAWSHGNSDWIFIFGEDTVAEGVVTVEQLRSAIPGDYSRSKGIAWYYCGGFALTQGFVSTQLINTRVVKWDSQA